MAAQPTLVPERALAALAEALAKALMALRALCARGAPATSRDSTMKVTLTDVDGVTVRRLFGMAIAAQSTSPGELVAMR